MTEETTTQPGVESNDDDIADRMTAALAEQQAEPAAEVEVEAAPVVETPKSIRVKINGEERDVSYDEIVTRYQKESAAEEKFQESARVRKDAEARMAEATKQQAEYKNYIDQAVLIAKKFMPAPPDRSMLNIDPVAYLEAKENYEEKQRDLQAFMAEQSYLKESESTRSKQESEQARLVALQQSQKALLKELPHWSDPKKAESERTRIAKHMRDLGISEERINSVTDYREVLAYRESMLYRELLAKTKAAPKPAVPPKVERPGVASVTDGRTAAMQRLSKSGSINDAASVFSRLI